MENLRIVKLTAENFKRLKAVSIQPGDNNVVKISGKNEQGKTTVIDCIWVALQGAAALKDTPEPVRKGASKAEITLDLGEYVVTRNWSRAGNSYLTVKNAEGATIKSPQTLLNTLIGDLAFDPLAFTRMRDNEQVEAFLRIIGVNLSAMDAERQGLYDERTVMNREVAKLKAHLDGQRKPSDDIPSDPVDITALMDEYRSATERQNTLSALLRRIDECKRMIESGKSRVKELQAELAQAEASLGLWEQSLKESDAEYNAMLPEPDTSEIQTKITNAQEINAAIETATRYRDIVAQLEEVMAQSKALTRQIDSIDEKKRAAIASAAMPVEGLSYDIDAGYLTLDGVPLRQASRAQKIKVSTAIGMAQNKPLRVMRIEDASVLDSESEKVIAELARDNDYQLWMEVVDETGEVGVYIEDGEIVATTMENAS